MCAAVRTIAVRTVAHSAFANVHESHERIEQTRIVARRGLQEVVGFEFAARVSAWHDAFAALPHTNVALFESDGVEFAAALYGAWHASKVVYLPGDVQPDTCRSLQALNVVFVGAFPPPFETIASPASVNREATLPAFDAHNAQLIIYTSGSTGAPQAVPKRLSQLLAEVESLERVFGEFMNDCDVIATVSHQHIYGLLFKILWPLQAGRAFVAESAVYPEKLIALLAERRAVVVSGPAHLKRLPTSLDWSSVRHNVAAVFSSGGPLPLDAATTTNELLGTTPVEVYGSSETGGIAWRQQSREVAAAWKPLPGVEVAERETQLAIRSPHLANNEWLIVPDNVQFDSNGHFTLLGRADRIAKIEGKRISLVGIETALMQSGLVAEVRVLPLESTRDELGAVVVPNERGWDVLREEQTRGLRAKLDVMLNNSVERIAHPRRWRWLDAVPVNAVGKTTNAALLELFGANELKFPAVHVVNSSSNEVTLELYVSPHLAAFDGHFVDAPILAGVVQVDWAISYARKFLSVNETFDRLEAVKFLRVYQPGALLQMQLQWKPERHLLAFRYDSGPTAHSSGRIFFRA